MADAGRSFYGVGKISTFEPKGYVDQADKHRHLQERADHRCKSLSLVNSEHGNRNRNCQFEVV